MVSFNDIQGHLKMVEGSLVALIICLDITGNVGIGA